MAVTWAVNPALVRALRTDDAAEFRSALEEERWKWPQDSPASDYQLLMKAIKLGRKRIANLLLDKGAEVYKNGSKTSPLHQAVRLIGWNGVVEKLLARGALVSVQNTRGDTVLHQAFSCGAPHPVMEMLLKAYVKESRMDKKNRDGLAFLHIASTREKTAYLQDYLDGYETDLDAQVSLTTGSAHAGYTALHFAVQYARLENAKILLQNGASVCVADVNGSTPIHLALERRNSKMIDLLFQYDVSNENIVNNVGLSHFMAACAGSDHCVVEQFINIADSKLPMSSLSLIHSRVNDEAPHLLGGCTPLHFAAECGQRNILHGLIAVGADPCAVSTVNMTPFMLAFARQHLSVCLLMSQICEHAVDEALFASMCANTSEAVVGVADSVAEVTQAGASATEKAVENLKREIADILDDADCSFFVEAVHDLPVADRRCSAVNTVIHHTPTRLEMAYELCNM